MAGNAGKGRRKGSRNKVPAALSEMILRALEQAGGVDYLVRMAKEQPQAFKALAKRAKALPLKLTGSPDDRFPDGLKE